MFFSSLVQHCHFMLPRNHRTFKCVDFLYLSVVNVGLRRTGEREGVRQSLGNISQRATQSDIAALSRRVVVQELDAAALA